MNSHPSAFSAVAVVILTAWAMSSPCPAQGDPFAAPGTPGPSLKTLDQAYPGKPLPSLDPAEAELNDPVAGLRISQPGRYYLTQALGPGTITIASSDVDLDLGGFEILSVNRAAAIVLDNVGVPGLARISIRNGFITCIQSDFNATPAQSSEWIVPSSELSAPRHVLLEEISFSAGVERVGNSGRLGGSGGLRIGNGGRIERCRFAIGGDSTSAGRIEVGNAALIRDCAFVGRAALTLGGGSAENVRFNLFVPKAVSGPGAAILAGSGTRMKNIVVDFQGAGNFDGGGAPFSFSGSAGKGIAAGDSCDLKNIAVANAQWRGIELQRSCRVENGVIGALAPLSLDAGTRLLDVGLAVGPGTRVDSVLVSNAGVSGLAPLLQGTDIAVSRSAFSNNGAFQTFQGSAGVVAWQRGSVEDVLVDGFSTGVSLQGKSLARRAVVVGDDSDPSEFYKSSYGIETRDDGQRIEFCLVHRHQFGISTFFGASGHRIQGNFVQGAAASGIRAGGGTSLIRNVINRIDQSEIVPDSSAVRLNEPGCVVTENIISQADGAFGIDTNPGLTGIIVTSNLFLNGGEIHPPDLDPGANQFGGIITGSGYSDAPWSANFSR